MPPTDQYRPAPRYGVLPALHDVTRPARFPRHTLRFRNQRAALAVGLDALTDPEWEAHFARFEPLPQNLQAPLALRYHGHQFRSYNPHLGDGRGFLFAQLRDQGGRLMDLGTKGTGATRYARGGDGRLTLKGAVREILAAEVLEALGVDTCRILSVYETGESLIRGDEPSPTRSAALVRLSHSHVRIGTFQRLEYEDDADAMDALLGYCVANFYPEIDGAADLPAAFLAAVTERLAETTARWMAAGFVHGVLNTDNMNVTGESFDYGPWRFLPRLDPGFTAAYFDPGGLYAYSRQPESVRWALVELADALEVLGERASLAAAVAGFEEAVDRHFRAAFLWRLGLAGDEDAAEALLSAWWDAMEGTDASFHGFFFDWYGGESAAERAMAGPSAAAYRAPAFAAVREALGRLAPRGSEAAAWLAAGNPCELRIEEVEALWAPIAARDDWGPVLHKLGAIRAMGAALGRP